MRRVRSTALFCQASFAEMEMEGRDEEEGVHGKDRSHNVECPATAPARWLPPLAMPRIEHREKDSENAHNPSEDSSSDPPAME